MEKSESNGLLWAVGILSVLCLLGVGYVATHIPSVDTSNLATKSDIDNIKYPVQNVDINGLATKEDVSKLKDKLDAGFVTISEADESKAKKLAFDDLKENDYKQIFKFLNTEYTIDDREDIVSVSVEKSTADCDDGDCTVTQKVKIKFYDNGSDEVTRVFLDVTTTINDWEVDDQEFELA